MKKRILIGILATMLLPQGLSAMADNKERSDILNKLKSAKEVTTDTVQEGWKFLTARNLVLLGTAYYVAIPALNRLQYLGSKLLSYGSEKGLGIGKISRLVKWLTSRPEALRYKLDPYSKSMHVPRKLDECLNTLEETVQSHNQQLEAHNGQLQNLNSQIAPLLKDKQE